MTRARPQGLRLLPRGRLDAAVQLLLFGAAYGLYRGVRGLMDGEAAAAFANARHLIDLERAAGLFFEPAVQGWALGQGWLVGAANWMYVNTHFAITTGFLVWLYLRRNRAFYRVRDTFLVAMAMALAGYALFPTAPPRLMPEWGFTDTVTAAVGEAAAQGAAALYNPFAAVPSMHVAFALMIAVPAVRLVRAPALRAAWAAYPAVVTLVVIVTANHFWLDAALGALVAAAATCAVLAAAAAPAVAGRRRAVPAGAPV